MAGALGAIGTGSASVLTSCAGGSESAAANKPLKEPGTYYIPELPDKATDGKEVESRCYRLWWTWFRCSIQLTW